MWYAPRVRLSTAQDQGVTVKVEVNKHYGTLSFELINDHVADYSSYYDRTIVEKNHFNEAVCVTVDYSTFNPTVWASIKDEFSISNNVSRVILQFINEYKASQVSSV
jgi:hypothetical protein